VKVFNFDEFCTETFRGFRNQEGQRIGQYFYNQFRIQFGIIEIPVSCDCFYADILLQEFLDYISTYDGCVLITNANLEALDKA